MYQLGPFGPPSAGVSTQGFVVGVDEEPGLASGQPRQQDPVLCVRVTVPRSTSGLPCRAHSSWAQQGCGGTEPPVLSVKPGAGALCLTPTDFSAWPSHIAGSTAISTEPLSCPGVDSARWLAERGCALSVGAAWVPKRTSEAGAQNGEAPGRQVIGALSLVCHLCLLSQCRGRSGELRRKPHGSW